MADVFISLGANLGDRMKNLKQARDELAARVWQETAASSVYETEPWGPVKQQGRFLNQVLHGATDLAPQALMAKLIEIEFSLGRERAHEVRYGARKIDLDILLYDDLVLRDRKLQIPHPRMMERAFVLVPLLEIAPDLVVSGTPVRDALARMDTGGITRLEPS